MKLKLLLFIWLLIQVLLVTGQNGDCNHAIKGRVLDAEKRNPIPKALVRIVESERYTYTDTQGYFVIEGLCSKNNTLLVSCSGYKEDMHDHNHDSEVHFYLSEAVIGLEEVTLKAESIKAEGTETLAQVILSNSEIDHFSSQTLASALSELEGVSFSSNGTNVQLPIIHGLYGNRILILNNGLKHGFQNWGTDHAPEIDIAAASKVTVIKGAAGVRYGPEALGGAIVIEPKVLRLNNPLYSNIQTGAESNGNGYHLNLDLGGGGKNWSFYTNGRYAKIGDRSTPDYVLTNSGKEEKTFGFGILRHFKDWDIKLHYSFVDQNLALLRASIADSPSGFIAAINSEEPQIIKPFSYDINAPNQTSQHQLVKGELNWWFANETRLTLIGGFQLNKRDEFDIRRNSELPIIDLDLLTTDYQLEWKHPEFLGLNGLVGVQYFHQNNDNNPGTQTTPFIPNYNTDRVSGFVVESIALGKTTLDAGLRLDLETNDVRGRETNQDVFRDRYSFSNFTATAGLSHPLSDNTTLRMNLGTAWRTPNMEELFSFGQHGFKTTFGLLRFQERDGELSTSEVTPLEESAVQPERGYKFISELNTYKNGNTHRLTVYSNYIQNYIFDRPIGVFGTIRGPMPGFIFDQVDAFFFGTDYTWKKEWTPRLAGTYGLSFLWTSTVGEQDPLINQPPISTNYELEWNQGGFWKFDNSEWKLRAGYTFEQFQAPRTITPQQLVDREVVITTDSEIFDFADPTKGFFLMDVSWHFGWKNLRGALAVQNLLNTRYRNYLNEMRYFADEPGRNILLSLSYQFKAKEL